MILGTYLTISADNIASTTEVVADLFDDLKGLVFLVIGLSIGFAILATIIDIFRGKIGPDWSKYGPPR